VLISNQPLRFDRVTIYLPIRAVGKRRIWPYRSHYDRRFPLMQSTGTATGADHTLWREALRNRRMPGVASVAAIVD
jgi:hypothetical protein